MCLLTMPAIFSMSTLATGKMALSVASGVMIRPWFNEFFLMYAQSFLIASWRGIFLPPQIAARLALKFTGAKRPMPFFFAAEAAFNPPAFRFFLTCTRLICSARFDGGFVVFAVVLAIVVLVVVVVVIAGGGYRNAQKPGAL